MARISKVSMLSLAAVLLLLSFCSLGASGLKFIAVPMPPENSPVLDLMAVAAHLQSRCDAKQQGTNSAAQCTVTLSVQC